MSLQAQNNTNESEEIEVTVLDMVIRTMKKANTQRITRKENRTSF